MRPDRRFCRRALLCGLALLLLCSCRPGLQTPHRVIVEGVVISGDTFRVDRLEAPIDEWIGQGLPAQILFENQSGERIEVAADEHGRFRIGPLAVAGDHGDRLVVRCPGSLALQLSYLLPPEVREASGGDAVVVRRRITLPHRPQPSAGLARHGAKRAG